MSSEEVRPKPEPPGNPLPAVPLLPRPTMKDVAALAKVSLKTVSRVINGETTVNEELAARVATAARQLRYQPDLGARALRRLDRRSSTVGVLLEDLSNPFSATIYRAIEESATTRGVLVLGGSLDESTQREHELTTLLMRHRVDGVVIAPASRDHQYLRGDQEAGVAFVFVDRPPVLLRADCVLSDSRGASANAVRHLMSVGHRRIAYVGDDAQIATARERYLGYLDVLSERVIALDPAIVVQGLRTSEQAMAAVTSLLRGAEPPTAVYASQNLVTVGAVQAIRALGLQHQVALVGFDDILLASLLEPAVTVVAQDPTGIGRAAAEILFERIGKGEGEVREEIVPCRLVPRGSGEIPLADDPQPPDTR